MIKFIAAKYLSIADIYIKLSKKSIKITTHKNCNSSFAMDYNIIESVSPIESQALARPPLGAFQRSQGLLSLRSGHSLCLNDYDTSRFN